jgi:hypothetical protein
MNLGSGKSTDGSGDYDGLRNSVRLYSTHGLDTSVMERLPDEIRKSQLIRIVGAAVASCISLTLITSLGWLD